jgi:hypothetical protein
MARTRLIALGVAFLFVLPAGAKDWQGVMLPDQPTQFIFGYGSLINSASRNSTAGKTVPAIPVRVSAAFGYIRAWTTVPLPGSPPLVFANLAQMKKP